MAVNDDEENENMTDDGSTALAVALAYYGAWSTHDFELAMTYIAR